MPPAPGHLREARPVVKSPAVQVLGEPDCGVIATIAEPVVLAFNLSCVEFNANDIPTKMGDAHLRVEMVADTQMDPGPWG